MKVSQPVISLSTNKSTGIFPLLFQSFKTGAKQHSLILITITIIIACQFLFLRTQPNFLSAGYWDYLSTAFKSTLIFAFLILLIQQFYLAHKMGSASQPTRTIIRIVLKEKTVWIKLANALPTLLAFPTFMFFFAETKGNIPILNPFSWDQYFANLDKAIHFGSHPWEWLHPVLSQSKPLVMLLQLNYNLWFIIVSLMWIIPLLMMRAGPKKSAFLVTTILTWTIGGVVFAIMLSSAGPAFYGKLGIQPNPYEPLLHHLQQLSQTPLFVLQKQSQLWLLFQENSGFNAISAMPSMHNAMAFLFILFGYSINRILGHVLLAHAVLIFIGSIYLAWHYAVDTYVSIALVLVLWSFSHYVANKWHAKFPTPS